MGRRAHRRTNYDDQNESDRKRSLNKPNAVYCIMCGKEIEFLDEARMTKNGYYAHQIGDCPIPANYRGNKS